jgi:hypothetical protein
MWRRPGSSAIINDNKTRVRAQIRRVDCRSFDEALCANASLRSLPNVMTHARFQIRRNWPKHSRKNLEETRSRDIDYAAAAAAARLLLFLIDGITRRSNQQKGAEIRCNLCTGGNCSTLCRRTTHGRIFLLSQHSGSLSSLLLL